MEWNIMEWNVSTFFQLEERVESQHPTSPTSNSIQSPGWKDPAALTPTFQISQHLWLVAPSAHCFRSAVGPVPPSEFNPKNPQNRTQQWKIHHFEILSSSSYYKNSCALGQIHGFFQCHARLPEGIEYRYVSMGSNSSWRGVWDSPGLVYPMDLRTIVT